MSPLSFWKVKQFLLPATNVPRIEQSSTLGSVPKNGGPNHPLRNENTEPIQVVLSKTEMVTSERKQSLSSTKDFGSSHEFLQSLDKTNPFGDFSEFLLPLAKRNLAQKRVFTEDRKELKNFDGFSIFLSSKQFGPLGFYARESGGTKEVFFYVDANRGAEPWIQDLGKQLRHFGFVFHLEFWKDPSEVQMYA